jgi:hypothetical protein
VPHKANAKGEIARPKDEHHAIGIGKQIIPASQI